MDSTLNFICNQAREFPPLENFGAVQKCNIVPRVACFRTSYRVHSVLLSGTTAVDGAFLKKHIHSVYYLQLMTQEIPSPRDLPYQSCYCEENVYKLCEALNDERIRGDSYVIFITSAAKAFPLWCQKAAYDLTEEDETNPNERYAYSSGNGHPVFWDYHVILVIGSKVYDHDSILPWGCSLDRYLQQAIQPKFHHSTSEAADIITLLNPSYRPCFRIVPISDYLAYFSSDRSHMQGTDQSPPPWRTIKGQRSEIAHCLPRYLDVKNLSHREEAIVFEDKPYGQLLTLATFCEWCLNVEKSISKT